MCLKTKDGQGLNHNCDELNSYFRLLWTTDEVIKCVGMAAYAFGTSLSNRGQDVGGLGQ